MYKSKPVDSFVLYLRSELSGPMVDNGARTPPYYLPSCVLSPLTYSPTGPVQFSHVLMPSNTALFGSTDQVIMPVRQAASAVP